MTQSIQKDRPLRPARVGALKRPGGSALWAGALLALAFASATHAQLAPDNREAAGLFEAARVECESGARTPTADARALGACDVLIRNATLDDEARASVLINRGVIAIRRGDSRSALTDLENAVSLEPGNGAAQLNLSAALINTGRYDDAIAAAELALAAGVTSPELAWFNRGVALERLRRFEAAYESYSEAANLAPANALMTAQPARFVWHQSGTPQRPG